MTEKKLTTKQQRFVLEYLVDGNATAAATRAGYAARSAYQTAHELMQHPAIKAAIETAEGKRLKKLEVKGEKVLAEIAHFAYSDLRDAHVTDKESPQYGTFKPYVEWPEHLRRAVKGLEVEELFEKGTDGKRFVVGRVVKVTLWPKEKGLELLGRNQKLFTDKVEVSADESLADILAEAMKGGRGGE